MSSVTILFILVFVAGLIDSLYFDISSKKGEKEWTFGKKSQKRNLLSTLLKELINKFL